jgi:cobalamin biosynthesis protein CbiD
MPRYVSISLTQPDYENLLRLRKAEDHKLISTIRRALEYGAFCEWLEKEKPETYYSLLAEFMKARSEKERQQQNQQPK